MKATPGYLRRCASLAAGLTILAGLLACAMVPDRLSPYDPLAFDFMAWLEGDRELLNQVQELSQLAAS